MSYETPRPEDEVAPAKDTGSESTSPTKPEDVNLEDGTDENEEPVENPAG
ncbi:hypothetical protein K2F54_10860 [Cryobacterium sp. 1639]|nr:hypothetical protein [Cryobacterium sp. 1639]MBX0300476.1 hypothetical protein [Cryobacterium sp. 1639]